MWILTVFDYTNYIQINNYKYWQTTRSLCTEMEYDDGRYVLGQCCWNVEGRRKFVLFKTCDSSSPKHHPNWLWILRQVIVLSLFNNITTNIIYCMFILTRTIMFTWRSLSSNATSIQEMVHPDSLLEIWVLSSHLRTTINIGFKSKLRFRYYNYDSKDTTL